MKKAPFLLLLVSLIVITPGASQDITKLVRIHEGDSWVYEIPSGFVNYTVDRTIVNRFDKEVNLILSNVTNPQLPFFSWQDSSYYFENGSTEDPGSQISGPFAIGIQIHDFQEYFSTRGNYWHGLDGEATITVLFGNKSLEQNISGAIWVNNGNIGTRGSQNLAIVTGEPQNEILTFWNNKYGFQVQEPLNQSIEFHITITFLIVPSDPYSTFWQGSNVTAVTITETLRQIDFYVHFQDVNGDVYWYEYRKESLVGEGANTGSNVYVYANEIGLPIEITRNLSISTSALKREIVASVKQSAHIERLIDYSIENSRLVVSESTSLIVFPLLGALLLLAYTWRHRYRFKRM
ncbi:MAG: hypothetical protein ACFFFG_11945 [Candidatus Thorarchaeota archaeon]